MYAKSLMFLLTSTLCFCLFFCGRTEPKPAEQTSRQESPHILLVTLDTTRGDRVGYAFSDIKTPNLDGLAAEGIRFERAYTTVPMTLPAHTSMLTGLYASEHDVHENARYSGRHLDLLPTKMRELGYATAAFVSAYPLAREFGLSQDFAIYDDSFPLDQSERTAQATTDVALEYLAGNPSGSIFLWVHYFDPHAPYEPPEPFKSQYPDDPYLGEIAFMDAQLGRLVDAFELFCSNRDHKILVVGDHGEGLGDHGEELHGSLLYEGCMRVPLVIAGSGVNPSVSETPVSIRRVFHTVLDWAGHPQDLSLMVDVHEIVMGEAMKPYLQYGWQPQVMAIDGAHKIIQSGELEVYNIVDDPGELENLSETVTVSDACFDALDSYAIPGSQGTGPSLTPEQEEKLAGLGYLSSTGLDARRLDGPNPKDMTHLFADLDRASGLFIKEEYAQAIAVFQRILTEDPGNLMVCLRLAVAHSLLDREKEAMDYFHRAQKLAPDSIDLKHYRAMHHFRLGQFDRAAPLFREVLDAMPYRLPAIECLAKISQNKGDIDAAVSLMKRVVDIKGPTAEDLNALGDLNMTRGNTTAAIAAFEDAERAQPSTFARHLELGVCYMAVRRFEEARDRLDRVDASHPKYPLALFKRAQVSVLLNEPDARSRVEFALANSDDVSRELILNEPLFKSLGID